MFIPATLPLLKKVLELHLGKGQRASLPQGKDPSHCFTVNASFLTKNGSDQLHHLTLPSRLGPEGSSYSKEEETAERNVLTVDGLSSSCSPFTRVLSC